MPLLVLPADEDASGSLCATEGEGTARCSTVAGAAKGSSSTCCAAHRDVFLPSARPLATPATPLPPAKQLLPAVTPVSTPAFLAVVEEVRAAISLGIYPTRISQGSSGSYFCRDSQGRIVGVFKPKNEEPYGHLNPKWTKWIHKNLFPCCFGRSCLIPNTGYVSEASASYVDRLLGLGCVPRTEIVYLAAPTFHYARKDRRAAQRNKRPLPPKIGSFQLFLTGYRDATSFFRDGYQRLSTLANAVTSSIPTNRSAGYATVPSETSSMVDGAGKREGNSKHPLEFNEDMQRQFRLGFERLVVLDYLIRNTDRGLDNWMVKCPAEGGTIERVDSAYDSQDKVSSSRGGGIGGGDHSSATSYPSSPVGGFASVSRKSSFRDLAGIDRRNRTTTGTTTSEEHQLDTLDSAKPDVALFVASEFDAFLGVSIELDGDQQATQQQHQQRDDNSEINKKHLPDIPSDPATLLVPNPRVEIAAIDNGLAFPHKHPDRYRSYPYGWSHLPIAQVPFSQETADALLPRLESESTMRELFRVLEQIMRVDDPFDATLFERQKAVIRGQAANLAEILRRRATPADLVKRPCVAVFEEIEYFTAGDLGYDEHHENVDDDTGALIENFRTRASGEHPDLIDRMELIFDDMRDKSKRQYVKIRRRFETLARQPFFTFC